jgi:hypothetical protein
LAAQNNTSLHELFVTFVMKSYVEISTVVGHVDQMALGLDEEPPDARRDVFDRDPSRGHASDFLGIEIIVS